MICCGFLYGASCRSTSASSSATSMVLPGVGSTKAMISSLPSIDRPTTAGENRRMKVDSLDFGRIDVEAGPDN